MTASTQTSPLDPDFAATALVADDEPLLRQAMIAELKTLWPALTIKAALGDGASAWQTLQQQPVDVAFLDIRMPGMTGLDVAQAIAEDWDCPHKPPMVVFATAYDEYAAQAFDAAAVDYLVKPVLTDRLARALQRIQQRLKQRRAAPDAQTPSALNELAQAVAKLLPGLNLTAASRGATTDDSLRYLRAGLGDTVRLLPVDQIAYLQAADKYVRVVMANGDPEALVREALKDLLVRLDPQRFLQIHRGTVVNLDEVRIARRDPQGHCWLEMRRNAETLKVSRVYAEHFKAM